MAAASAAMESNENANELECMNPMLCVAQNKPPKAMVSYSGEAFLTFDDEAVAPTTANADANTTTTAIEDKEIKVNYSYIHIKLHRKIEAYIHTNKLTCKHTYIYSYI